ncbi:MAG: glycosyltransferase family 2 protein [bacterium]
MKLPRARPDASEPAAFSVVIPAFDEEQALRATLDAVREALAGGGHTFELVVVDDGSTDATPQILAAYADLTVVRHEVNRGYGAALKAGISAARHGLVVVMDADGTYPATMIPQLVAGCADADMVVGARIGRNVHSTPARSAVKWCFRQFAQWITRAAIPDLNSGLRAFRRPVAERFTPLLPNGFSFTTTITVAALLERLVVRFEPVDYMPRIGRSKVRPLRDTTRIARQLGWLGVHLAPLRTSLAVAVPLLGIGAALILERLVTGNHVGAGPLVWPSAGLVILAIGARAEQCVRRRRDQAAADFVPVRNPLG